MTHFVLFINGSWEAIESNKKFYRWETGSKRTWLAAFLYRTFLDFHSFMNRNARIFQLYLYNVIVTLLHTHTHTHTLYCTLFSFLYSFRQWLNFCSRLMINNIINKLISYHRDCNLIMKVFWLRCQLGKANSFVERVSRKFAPQQHRS